MTVHPEGLPAPLNQLQRCLVFGVLNVTPDSFSDGGRFTSTDEAIKTGIALHRSGADVVDVGGESTRPGATRVSADEEWARVGEVVAGLAEAGVPVSIDTMRAGIAADAVAAGAIIVNDVSGGLADPEMVPAVAEMTVPYILMHWRAHAAQMDSAAEYDDVVVEVTAELRERLEACAQAGLAVERIVLDPGLGFAKEPAHNWSLLHWLPALQALGRPVLVGASRKRFLGEVLASPDGTPRPIEQRADATDAVSALAAYAGAWAVRVHDVRGSLDAVLVAQAWQSGRTR